jgi:hypothetical protein
MAAWFWGRDCASSERTVRQINSPNNVSIENEDAEQSDILTLPIKAAVKAGTECLLCWLAEKEEIRFLELFYSEGVMNPSYRAEIIHTRGFCSYHQHRLLWFVDEVLPERLGLALVLENLVREPLISLERVLENSQGLLDVWRGRGIKAILKGKLLRKNSKSVHRFARSIFVNLQSLDTQCPACKSLEDSDTSHVDTLIKMLLHRQGFIRIFKEESKGLCLPHFNKTIMVASERLKQHDFASFVEILLPLQVRHLKRIRVELSERIRKYDYRFANEPIGSGVDIVERATRKLKGTSHYGPISARFQTVEEKLTLHSEVKNDE